MGPEELARAAQSARQTARRETLADRRRCAAESELSAHPHGRPRLGARAATDRFLWGRAGAPKVTLVGKGVCFDSGGLDLKTVVRHADDEEGHGRRRDRARSRPHDHGCEARSRLRVLIPAVENSVSGTAYRPGDVIPSRKGLKIEIGNTDAEGRLVLADALTEADSETPELLIDIATLTGAARAATGFDLPPFFTDDEKLASDLMRHGTAVHDPMWRLPLWRGYESAIQSSIADLNNSPDYNLGGAITAALFLNRFVVRAKSLGAF